MWDPPPPDDQNGIIIGYNLTCPDVTISLDSTLTSPDTTITITSGVRPFVSYSCTLTALNIVGSSPPTTCSFETAPDCEWILPDITYVCHPPPPPPSAVPSPPIKCSNATFFSRQVTLVWDAPLPDEQNGIISGYNLTCPDISSKLDSTFTSPTTNITIASGVRPFTNYICTLTALNMVGSSPPTTCIFQTEQDGEYIYIDAMLAFSHTLLLLQLLVHPVTLLP